MNPREELSIQYRWAGAVEHSKSYHEGEAWPPRNEDGGMTETVGLGITEAGSLLCEKSINRLFPP